MSGEKGSRPSDAAGVREGGTPVPPDDRDNAASADAVPQWLHDVMKSVARHHRAATRGAKKLPTPDAESTRDTPSNGGADLTWGPLQLRRILGHGAFGTVYLAWDPQLQRKEALKILTDPRQRESMLREGRMLAKIQHPNVVTVYDVEPVGDTVGLRMELIDGRTIHDVLSAHGAMPAREAALMGADLSRALAAVHKAGLLHRDIKAHNVMRDNQGRIVLMDFGAGEIKTDRIGGARRAAGTPLYLAPEVIAGGPCTIASDIYSLGVLLYHAVSLRYPVEGDSLREVEAAHRDGRMMPLVDLRPDLPELFVRAVDCALDRDPAKRHRSAGAFHQALSRVLQDDTVPSPRQPVPREAMRAVAVVPFASLGPDQNLEYFCTGLAEELAMALGAVPGLRVASRTSALVAQAANLDATGMCRQIGVDALLEGTVRKQGDRIRISAQLISGVDGCHLWSEGYDRVISDALAVQEEIARSVADRLRVRLSDLPARPLIRSHSENPRAFEFYLRGRHSWAQRYSGGLDTAIAEFRRAIEEDAGYALAHAGLADAYAFKGFYSIERPRDAFARARDAAERALQIASDRGEALAEAHTSLALVKLGGAWDWHGAEREFTAALELDPRQTFPRVYLSWLLVLRTPSDIPQALEHARKAQELDPLSPLINSGVAHTLFLAGDYDGAIDECRKALQYDPVSIVAIYIQAACMAMRSRLEEAISLMERAAAMSRRSPFYLAILGNFYARAGREADAHHLIAELDAMAASRYVPPQSYTFIYAGLDDLDRAFEWEAKAADDGAPPFNYFSPIIRNLHDDPRHIREMERMPRRR